MCRGKLTTKKVLRVSFDWVGKNELSKDAPLDWHTDCFAVPNGRLRFLFLSDPDMRSKIHI